jgi:hypothetical protein
VRLNDARVDIVHLTAKNFDKEMSRMPHEEIESSSSAKHSELKAIRGPAHLGIRGRARVGTHYALPRGRVHTLPPRTPMMTGALGALSSTGTHSRTDWQTRRGRLKRCRPERGALLRLRLKRGMKMGIQTTWTHCRRSNADS